MKLSAQLFYKARGIYPELKATTVTEFLKSKNLEEQRTAISNKYVAVSENETTLISDTDGNIITRLGGSDGSKEITAMVDGMLLDKAVDELLEYVYDTLAAGGTL